jgi:hypothetical protein
MINNSVNWQHKHTQALVSNYRKAPHYEGLKAFFEDIFSTPWESIAQLNIEGVKRLSAILGIQKPVYVSSELGEFPQDPDERLIGIVKHFSADTYLAGAGGKAYMDLEKYKRSGVEVLFQDFRHPVYRQVFGDFEPFMSVIDLIFNHGDESLEIVRGAQ